MKVKMVTVYKALEKRKVEKELNTRLMSESLYS